MIDDWAARLAGLIAEVSPLKAVYTHADLPGKLVDFPCAILLPERGTQMWGSGAPNIAVHDMRLTVYVSPQILPEAYAVAVSLIGAIRNKIASTIKLGGQVSHVIPRAPFYEGPGNIDYGVGVTGGPLAHVGIVFNLEVKEVESFTVSP